MREGNAALEMATEVSLSTWKIRFTSQDMATQIRLQRNS